MTERTAGTKQKCAPRISIVVSIGEPVPVPSREWRHGDYLLTDDPKQLDLDVVCALLHSTYWADDRPRSVIEKAIRHSVCLSLLHEGRQVGIIRGVTDQSTFTWVCDVIVHPDHRGRGLGKWIVQPGCAA